MANLSCAFFGHKNYDYTPYEDKIRERIVYLINRGVTEFYNGYRGRFDSMCARIVHDLKKQYPQIKNIMVLSYMPDNDFEKPDVFDETVYLLEQRVPLKYAISHTNRMLVQTVNYIVSGVVWKWGGARTACNYAEQLYRTVFYVVGGYSFCDFDWAQRQWDELSKDEQYRKEVEEKSETLYLKIKDEVEANIVKHARKNAKKKQKEYQPPTWVSVTNNKETAED